MHSSFAAGQDIEADLLGWLKDNSFEKLQEHFQLINRKYPSSDVTLFLKAYIETDGERAAQLYQQFIQRFPKSEYTDNALLKLAQYYYAVGSYIAAREYLDNLIDQFPNSPAVPLAKYSAARCLLAMGYYDSAEKELKEFIKKFPNSPYKIMAQQELNLPREQDQSESAAKETAADKNKFDKLIQFSQGQGQYTLQIGAFGKRDNAAKLKETFSQKGYDVEITTKYLSDQLLYLVWIGEFETEEQARRFGADLKNRYDITFQVVRK
ncbi:MAG: tetratricopeptide repeat protein [bacterium]|nr:tetratricopeptide repeat protein [bacterium]